MDFAIIAAGEGSRLKKGGISHSKPMVKLGGVSLVERLMQIFLRNGAQRLLIIINEQSPDVESFLQAAQVSVPLVVVKKSTPSSLHSFYELLPHVQSDKLCLTTVDTVFDEATFGQFIAAFEQSKSWDGFMAVTPFVDDESPLYVQTDASLRITAFNDNASEDAAFVSGGIYCLRNTAFRVVNKAIDSGTERMRNFQRMLLAEGLQLQAYPFEKIIDIDRVEDMAVAEAWLYNHR